jgi:dipeptidyl aminopeptidase/acylaminoacyl peptidase
MLIGSTYFNRIPQCSPEGSKIAFQSNRSGNAEIWTCDSDGANCQQLTSYGGPVTGAPRWSPDSRWLAFDSRAAGQTEIYVIAADGGVARRMTEHPASDSVPSWSRDGRWIYFNSDRTGRFEVWKISADGGQAVQVTNSGGVGAQESPDGNIYYWKPSAPSASPLWKMPIGGGEEKQVLPAIGYWADFHVSAKGVHFFSPDRRTIQFLDAGTGKVSTLATLDRKGGLGICVSPDDAYVVFAQVDRDTTDLMLVENFR